MGITQTGTPGLGLDPSLVRIGVEQAGHMAGQLFVRSLDRSDRVYQAMLARGYHGELLTLAPHAMRPADWAALAGGLALILALHGLGFIG